MKKLLKIALGVILFFLITGLIGIIFKKPIEEYGAKQKVNDSLEKIQDRINDSLQYIEEQKEERQEKIEKMFDVFDGSHITLTKAIKKTMNDPDSYQHIETVYWDMNDYLVVRTTFSGKNAFGGRVKNWVKVKSDIDGNIIEVIDEGN